jgi:hypothetical protein
LRRGDRPLVASARLIAESLLGDGAPSEATRGLVDELRLFVGEDEAAYLLKS